MKRNGLLGLLKNYHPFDNEEHRMWLETIDFVQQNPDCFERFLSIGHVTGSAWIIDHSHKYVLLMHHRKLDRWFQPGGHADGMPDVQQVAFKEAQEETGLIDIQILSLKIFDIDVHLIPTTPKEVAHYHYDIRFLMQANRSQLLQINSESKNLAWVLLEDVPQYNNSESIMRMVKKTKNK